MEERCSLLVMAVKGVFQLDQLLRLEQVELMSALQLLLNCEPNRSVFYTVVPSFQTDLRNLVDSRIFNQIDRYFLRKRCAKISTIDLIEAILDICALRVGDGHKIDLAHPIEVVNWDRLFSPEGIGLFLRRKRATSGTSSMIPWSTLFLYSSKICLSRSTSIS